MLVLPPSPLVALGEETSKAIGELVFTYVSGRRARGQIRPETARSYRYKLGAFAAFVGPQMPVDRVRRRHVERFLETVSVGDTSKRHYLSALRVFFRWAVETRQIRADPTTGVEGPPEPRRLPRAIPATDVEVALSSAPDLRAQLVMLLCVQECLRISEVARLQIGDVDFLKRSLYVRDGKGGHDRRVPITDETFEAIQAYLGPRPSLSGPLIRSLVRPRCGVTGKYLSARVSKWMHEAGVNSTAHPLRHTGATDMADAGVPVRELQAILGHAKLSSTEVYTGRASLEAMRRAIAGRTYRAQRAEADEAG